MTDRAAEATGTTLPSARQAAIELLSRILDRGQGLDEVLDDVVRGMEPRERRFAHTIVLASLRHKGSIEQHLKHLLDRPLPKSGRQAELILLSGIAQIIFLQSPAHAVVNEQVAMLPEGSKFRGVVNAILRKVDRQGAARLVRIDMARRDTPLWLWKRWAAHLGRANANALAAAHRDDSPTPLDLTVAGDAEEWARTLEGELLPTGSVRLRSHAGVPDMPGYLEGAWWVQDTAATLPVRLFGDLTGKTLLDACAAPGGKTAQAIALGASVTALDRSGRRLEVLERNLSRLRMQATVVRGDLRLFKSEAGFDAVLLDAPCSATGTIRRHPEIAWTRKEEDIQGIAEQQRHMIRNAAALVRPGGKLVYCTCSLEPEEGEAQADWLYDTLPEFSRLPVDLAALGLPAEALTPAGDLRTHSGLMKDAGGMDGFFATVATRTA
ncbi:MAG: transcription antitermination factor NusB [Minwuia sp.]|nr:transcription antitermination factor NusB [Minwuia sp.]